jgi:hydroxyethylthiazole kinase-like uncharacterized protein yjeF
MSPAVVSPVVVTPAVLRRWPLPDSVGGKEQQGHVLVVAGTATTPGAALLAAEAALRAGAGKLSVLTTETTAATLAVGVPEAMVVPAPVDPDGNLAATAADLLCRLAQGTDAVVIGPGFGDPAASTDLLGHALPRLDVATVLDATASAYLGQRPHGLRHLEGRSVLTVNPHELAQTAHRSLQSVEEDPAAVAGEVAATTGAVVLCGGTSKHVVAPDGRCWVIEGGGPVLGVSGSGDVQAGIVTGLLARGAEPAQAAVWAAYVHGRVGERLAAAVGPVGALAREQLGHVPRVLAEVG